MIKADYIFLNGNFYTMRQPDETFEAMAVLNGRIVAVGDTKTIRKIEARQEIDLEGKTILPGFMDTHMHFIMDADDRQKVELLQADSIDDIISRMKAQDSPDASPEEWLVGRSIHVENIKEGRFPDRHELDRISTERPVFLFTYCRHTGMGNTKALELAGIGKGFVPEVEGTVEFEEDGSPSGIIRETAYNRYFSPIMDANLDSAAYRKKLAKKFAPEYSKAGLTTLHSYSTISAEPLEYLYMYLELEEEGLLPFRVRMSSAMPLAKTIGAATGLGSDK
ncbi:MAG: amidohydrolase family protein, partial [Phoenicibacter congonensis]|nr:amidohydrolase family protein [Phoenicibacter congonensis]